MKRWPPSTCATTTISSTSSPSAGMQTAPTTGAGGRSVDLTGGWQPTAALVIGTRLALTLVGIAAAMALALAVVGVYGVLAYAVARRRHEVGIRLALGAQPGAVRAVFVRQGLLLTSLGGMLGLVSSVALSRWISPRGIGASSTSAPASRHCSPTSRPSSLRSPVCSSSASACAGGPRSRSRSPSSGWR